MGQVDQLRVLERVWMVAAVRVPVLELPPRIGLFSIAPILCSAIIGSSIACGSTGAHSVSSPAADPSSRYVGLVHNYWIQYKKAEGDIPSFADECGYYSTKVQPSVCRPRIAAILPVHEKFLADLDVTPAPAQFAADDQAFRTQLPIAIAHLRATIVAADAGNAQSVSAEVEAYVETMVHLFPNLDHVDPSITHD
ncbi:MAG TPA: hypothetical protein VHQ03_09970 [Candidatus Dormibacteraeota bacterium]|nr:hypothetical protein [Candidatus Dormibacteraeota bacterium]